MGSHDFWKWRYETHDETEHQGESSARTKRPRREGLALGGGEFIFLAGHLERHPASFVDH